MTLFDVIVIIFQRIILSECYDGPLNGAKSNVALKTGMAITARRFTDLRHVIKVCKRQKWRSSTKGTRGHSNISVRNPEVIFAFI